MTTQYTWNDLPQSNTANYLTNLLRIMNQNISNAKALDAQVLSVDGDAGDLRSLVAATNPLPQVKVQADDSFGYLADKILGGDGITVSEESDVVRISSDMSDHLPIAAVIPFGGNTAPTGWLKCNGAAISRSTYADLFSAIGTAFGVGDGSTTFNIPDLRGEFIRGYDDGRGVDSGRSFGSAQADDFKSHTHSYNPAVNYTGDYSCSGSGGSTYIYTTTTNAAGGAETRPRNLAALYIIKYT